MGPSAPLVIPVEVGAGGRPAPMCGAETTEAVGQRWPLHLGMIQASTESVTSHGSTRASLSACLHASLPASRRSLHFGGRWCTHARQAATQARSLRGLEKGRVHADNKPHSLMNTWSIKYRGASFPLGPTSRCAGPAAASAVRSQGPGGDAARWRFPLIEPSNLSKPKAHYSLATRQPAALLYKLPHQK